MKWHGEPVVRLPRMAKLPRAIVDRGAKPRRREQPVEQILHTGAEDAGEFGASKVQAAVPDHPALRPGRLPEPQPLRQASAKAQNRLLGPIFGPKDTPLPRRSPQAAAAPCVDVTSKSRPRSRGRWSKPEGMRGLQPHAERGKPSSAASNAPALRSCLRHCLRHCLRRCCLPSSRSN